MEELQISLAAARVNAGLTQEEVAKMMGGYKGNHYKLGEIKSTARYS